MMKRLTKQPKSMAVPFRDGEACASFDYDSGEAQYFDARAGIGSPGYPPSLELTELVQNSVTIPLDFLTDDERASIEQFIMDAIDEDESQAWSDYPEAEADRHAFDNGLLDD